MDGRREGLEQQRVGWSSVDKRVMEGATDYLENCANMEVDTEALERLMEPENRKISLRYILKFSTKGGSNILHIRETGPLRGKQKKMVGESGKNVAQQESQTKGMILSIKE